MKPVLFQNSFLTLALILFAVIAFGQEQINNELNTLEHIEVTARKTVENLQRVPVAVTSLSATKLEEKGMEVLSEVQQFSPNTTLQAGTATNSTLVAFIRGVGQEDQLWGYESGVGIYIDDVYIARPQGAILEILNIERIEVLRGPQGTLYGKNTLGGAIKYITPKMTGDGQLNLKATLGDYNRQDFSLVGQYPLLDDKLYFGFAAANLSRDGYGDFKTSDLVGQNTENFNKDVFAGRFNLEYSPNEQLFIRLSYDKTDDQTNAKGGHRFLESVLPDSFNIEPIPDNVYHAGTSLPTWNTLDIEGLSLTMEYAPANNWSLKSITARRENDSLANIDFDNTSLRLFDIPAIYDDQQFSQEFQFNYRTDKLNLVSGLYYYDAESCGTFNAILDVLGEMMLLPGFALEVRGCSNSKSHAVYSQGSYLFNDKLSLTLGARFTREEKDAIVYNGAFFGPLYPKSGWVPGYIRDQSAIDPFVPKVLDDSEKWSRLTPRLGFEYQQTQDILWYISYAQGFKSGMFNPRAATPEPAVNPEIVDSIELGIKSDWDNSLRINATLFMLDHKDRQFVTVLEGDGPGDLDQRLGNIGKSEAHGAELELSYAANSRLNIDLTLGYIDSDFTQALAYNGVGYDDISDRFSIINTPELTANLGFDYSIASEHGIFVINGNYYYRSEYDLIVLDNLKSQSGFGLANLSLNWYSDNDKWQAGLHIKNITDERYLTGSFAFVTRDENTGDYVPGLAGDNILNDYYGPPRTIALTLGYQF